MNITRALEIEGWMEPNELEWLATIAEKSHIIFEFGSHYGRSTRALADNTTGVVFAIDPWHGIYYDDGNKRVETHIDPFPTFRRNLRDHIECKRVIPIRRFSYEAGKLPTPDFVFIDGDHRFNNVVADISHAMMRIRFGTIAGHDYTTEIWPGVKKAVDLLLPECNKGPGSIWWQQWN